MASTVFRDCAERGINLSMVNMGGGFPTKYLKDIPPVVQYGRSIFRALRKHFGNAIPETIIEPAAAWSQCGIIETEVVLISKKSDEDDVRWCIWTSQIRRLTRPWTSRSATRSAPA